MRRAPANLSIAAAGAALAFCAASAASARTAMYVSPDVIDQAALSAVSRSGDRTGLAVPLNETFALYFDVAFGIEKNADKVTIFTLDPSVGDARGVISFGRYFNGSPVIVRTQNINSGASFSIGNLYQMGCGKIGGCNYIAVTTERARNGATGVIVDYIDINGEVTEVSAPTPEPSAWTLMIAAFAAVAARLKARRTTPACGVRSAA
jgi:hypothetical protein